MCASCDLTVLGFGLVSITPQGNKSGALWGINYRAGNKSVTRSRAINYRAQWGAALWEINYRAQGNKSVTPQGNWGINYRALAAGTLGTWAIVPRWAKVVYGQNVPTGGEVRYGQTC